MKKFLEKVLEWKTWSCLMFTGSVIVYMLITWYLGVTSIPLLSLFSLLIVSAVGTFIQYLVFTKNIIKNMRYVFRLLLFMVTFFLLLTLVAYLFNWVPFQLGAWVMFGAVFFIVFAGMTVGFEIFFRITGKKYDGILGQYKKDREQSSQTKN